MISRVDAPDDPRLAPYRSVTDPHALARAGLFAVEGRLIVPRLFASARRVHSLLLSERALASLSLESRPDVDVLVATSAIITETGGFNFHRGCLALGYRDDPGTLDDLLRRTEQRVTRRAPIVILEGVNNPDNVGGIFRSAHAFDARAIVLGPGCGDPLYRKAIRTSMGATLDVPWAPADAWPDALDRIRAAGYRVMALTTGADAPPLGDAVLASPSPVALLLGSEGFGLSPDALARADAHARIPMANAGADSLNVAAAASIALYEVREVRGVREVSG